MAQNVEEHIIRLRDEMSASLGKIDKNVNRLRGNLNKTSKQAVDTTKSFRLLRSAFIAIGGIHVARNIGETAIEMERLQTAIRFTSGGGDDYKDSINSISKVSDSLSISLLEATRGFKTLSSSMVGSGISNADAIKIFEGVSTGISGAALSADDARGVFLALGQIASKGKLSAEEVRRQLGDRLPGAFSIAAQSMRMTVAELSKALEDGAISAKEFLPKFAATIKQTYQQAVPEAIQTSQAALNRLSTAFTRLKVIVFHDVAPIFMDAIDWLIVLASKIIENIGAIKTLIKVLAISAVTMKVLPVFTRLWGLSLRFAGKGALFARFAIIKLRVAIKALLVSTGIGLLVALLSEIALGFLDFGDQAGEASSKLDKLSKSMAGFSEASKKLSDVKNTMDPNRFVDKIEGLTRNELVELSKQLNKDVILQKTLSKKFDKEGGRSFIMADIADRTVVDLNKKIAQVQGLISGIDSRKSSTSKFGTGSTSSDSSSDSKSLESGVATVRAGSPKVININIDSLIEDFKVMPQTMKEGASNIKEIVARALLEALTDAQVLAR